MGLQKHSKVLNDTVEMLSDEGSYHQLFHAYRDEEALPSGKDLFFGTRNTGSISKTKPCINLLGKQRMNVPTFTPV